MPCPRGWTRGRKKQYEVDGGKGQRVDWTIVSGFYFRKGCYYVD